MEERQGEIKLDNKSALLTFLELTKEGKFAVIDTASLTYGRMKEEIGESGSEEEYFYGVS